VSVLVIYFVVPEAEVQRQQTVVALVGLRAIYTDPHFWCIAPLSAMTITASWSIQGLWAAPWLAHVEELERTQVAAHLFVMVEALSAGALLGVVEDRLRRRGVSPQNLFAATAQAQSSRNQPPAPAAKGGGLCLR
jgi:hypothetical protein